MPKYVIDKRDFFKALSQSEEVGGFFRDMQGINLHSPQNVGVLMNNSKEVQVYSEGSSPALTTPITQLIQYGDGGIQAIAALSKSHAVRIRTNAHDGENVATTVSFSGTNDADKKGAALYHLGSQSNNNLGIFYSLDTDIGVYDVGGGSGFGEADWDENFMSTEPAGGAIVDTATFRTMYWHKRHDILYWNAGSKGNEVDKYDANIGVKGTHTPNALDLPENWEIRDFGQLRDYLAILATTPESGSADDEFIQFKSKVFFWDGVKDSWTYETPEIADRLVRLINTEKGLFAIGQGDGISYYQIELEQADKLNNLPKNGIDLTAGRRDGNDIANYGAITTIGNELLFLGKEGANAHIFSAGDRFGLSSAKVIAKRFLLKSASNLGAIRLGDLVAVTPTKYYASYWNDVDGSGTASAGDQYRIVRFSPANANTKDARVDTVELDSYFGGDGRLKKLNWIRFDIDELATGDVLEIYKEIDYDGTWTRLDGASSAGAENSIRESDFSGESRTMIKFTRQDQFRHLRLRFDWTGGSVKIRRIVINFDNQE